MPFKKLITIIIANKLFLFLIGLAALATLPFGDIYYENLATYDSGMAFLNQWTLWDADSYIQIARDGYSGRYFAYFPFWPMVLKLGSYLTFGNYAAAGLLLNLAFSIGAAVMLFKLAKFEFKEEKTGLWANAFLFFFPTAFFLMALYNESLFLFLAVSAMYFLRRKKWLGVAVFTFFAAMTREVGGMLLFPIMYSVWRDRKGIDWEKILALVSPILGTLAVMGIYYVTSGDPLIFLEKHSEFGKTLSLPYVPIVDAIANLFPLNFESFYYSWNLFVLAGAIYLIVKAYKILAKEHVIYSIAMLLPPLCSSNLEGFSRYVLVVFPLFLVLGKLKNKKILAIYGLFLGILALFTIRYTMGGTGTYPFVT